MEVVPEVSWCMCFPFSIPTAQEGEPEVDCKLSILVIAAVQSGGRHPSSLESSNLTCIRSGQTLSIYRVSGFRLAR